MTPSTDDLQLLDVPRIGYPSIAQSARIRGSVVVKLSLAADGTVTSATSLAGSPLLTTSALDHARGLRFAAAGHLETIVVYEFTFIPGLIAESPCGISTLNELVYPRFIRISVSAPCVQP